MKNVRKYMSRHELGQPEQSVPLTPSPPPGEDDEPHLVLSELGLYVISATSPDAGRARRLDDGAFSYEQDEKSGRLVVGQETFEVKPRHTDQARLMIHRARLLGQGKADRALPEEARHVESLTLVAKVWLRSSLDDDEDLLAWLEADSEDEKEDKTLYFLVTSRRASLVLLHPSGDGEETPVPEQPLVLEAPESWLDLGRKSVRCGDVRWATTRTNVTLYQEIAPLVGTPLPAKLMELARWNWKRGTKSHAEVLLTKALEAGEPHAGVIRHLRFSGEQDTGPTLSELLSAVVAAEPDSTRLNLLCEERDLGFEPRRDLLDAVLALDELPRGWAIPLFRAVHALAAKHEKEESAKTRRRLDFADYLVRNDGFDEAAEVLEEWLDARPGVDVRGVLPPVAGAELAEDFATRIRALDLLGRARSRGQGLDDSVLAPLAQLQPLDKTYLLPLVEAARGSMEQLPTQQLPTQQLPTEQLLASHVGLLEPGGLVPEVAKEPSVQVDAPPLKALTKSLIDETLQHQAAREGSTWGMLQGMLAKASVPDVGALRSFCERLGQDPVIRLASADASHVLGTQVPEIYVSRGEQAVGLRAFESKPPFILIGSEHLNTDSPIYLRPEEMRFGIAAELAHLRYKHTRATAQEVRDGALKMSLSALGFALSLVPFASSAGKLGVLKKVPKDALDKVSKSMGFVHDLAGKLSGSGKSEAHEDFISISNEDVVEAHRVMQLTADRAGLLLCGDPRPAIRYMFLSCSAYYTEIQLVERAGLPSVVEKLNDSGSLVYEDLLIRIGNLLAFHLSDDYRQLREAAGVA